MRQQAGLTLIELMIALVLGLILLAGVIAVIVSGQTAYHQSQRFTQLQSDFSFISDSLLIDGRGATQVDWSAANKRLTFTKAASTVSYQLNDTQQLVRTDAAGVATLIAEGVTMFTPQCVDGAGVAAACVDAVALSSTIELAITQQSQQKLTRIEFVTALRNAVLTRKFAVGGV